MIMLTVLNKNLTYIPFRFCTDFSRFQCIQCNEKHHNRSRTGHFTPKSKEQNHIKKINIYDYHFFVHFGITLKQTTHTIMIV